MSSDLYTIALWWPLFRLEVLQGVAGRRQAEPVALIRRAGRHTLIELCNDPAAELGVRAGMALERAKALGDLTIIEADPLRWQAASAALLERAHAKLGGHVEALRADLLLVRAHLSFLRDQSWRENVSSVWPKFGEPRIGIGSNRFVARSALVFLCRGPGWGLSAFIAAGDEEASLAPLPLDALPLTRAERELLYKCGVNTLGELTQMPTQTLRLQLRERAAKILALARGQDPRRASATPLPAEAWVERHAEIEWTSREQLLFVFRGALAELIERLSKNGGLISQLDIHLSHRGASRADISLRAQHPNNSAKTWHLLWDTRISHLDLDGPTDLLALHAQTISSAGFDSAPLPSEEVLNHAQLAGTWLRLRERAPEASWLTATSTPALWVEERSVLAPLELGRAPNTDRPILLNQQIKPRSWRLYSEPLQIMVEELNGRPHQLIFNDERWSIEALDGPWQMESRWWDNERRATFWEAKLRAGAKVRICKREPHTWLLTARVD